MNSHPTKSKKRIDLLDVYRGFAILGIFVVNIVIMSSTFLNQDEYAKQWTSINDQISTKILQLFFYTKFFPIFSLLFGLGISMQVLKSKLPFSFFSRRMLILFFFGVFHIIFLWSGDVLHLYALLGFLLIFIIKKSNKTIISLSIVVILFPFYNQCFRYVFNILNFHPENFLSNHTGQTVSQIVKHGSYTEGIHLRLLEYASNSPMLLGFLAPVIISMFLIGAYLGKNSIHLALNIFINRIKKPMLYIAVISNIYRVLFLFILTKESFYSIKIYRHILINLMVLSDVFMGLFYLWLIGWIWHYTKWKIILSPLKYVGRMALTNYIMHSFIGLILFSSIGFQLYETLSPTETLLAAVAVFIFQIVFSKFWLTHFQFGPLEWVWRCLSYNRLLPIKKQ